MSNLSRCGICGTEPNVNQLTLNISVPYARNDLNFIAYFGVCNKCGNMTQGMYLNKKEMVDEWNSRNAQTCDKSYQQKASDKVIELEKENQELKQRIIRGY